MSLQNLKTSKTLLHKARDWADQQAWNEMFRRYDPLLERWSRRHLKCSADVAEVNQRVWIELAQRIVQFRYDPGKSFRSWLRTLHRSRLNDFLKAKSREIDIHETISRQLGTTRSMHSTGQGDTTTGDDRLMRLEQLQARMMQIQAKVKSRVQERTWEVYWAIAIQGQTIGDTAKMFGMTYAATFAAVSRVEQQLKDEANAGAESK